MTRVLVVTAVELETRSLARQLGLERVGGSAWPHFRGGALELLCVGPRAAHIDARAAGSATTLVVSAGVCGALAPDLAEGDLVVPEAVVGAGAIRHATAALPGLRRAGHLLTVDAVVSTAELKARLWMETGAHAVDMESAVILAWARERGVPAAVVRAVSDDAGHGIPAALSAAVGEDGRVRPLRAVAAALSRATALGDLLELRAGTEAALKSVAGALAKVARA